MDNTACTVDGKMRIFDKTKDLLVVDVFKNVFQRRSSEVLKSAGCPVDPDNPQVSSSLLIEHRRTTCHVGWSQGCRKKW